MADLAVASRCWLRGEKDDCGPKVERRVSATGSASCAPVPAREEAVEGVFGCGLELCERRRLLDLARRDSSVGLRLALALELDWPATAAARSSSPTQMSHRIQPRMVQVLLHDTTVTGDTRSWKMPTKQTRKMATEQTCWTMTVESATSGQNS
jgi:hypothetical protein